MTANSEKVTSKSPSQDPSDTDVGHGRASFYSPVEGLKPQCSSQASPTLFNTAWKFTDADWGLVLSDSSVDNEFRICVKKVARTYLKNVLSDDTFQTLVRTMPPFLSSARTDWVTCHTQTL